MKNLTPAKLVMLVFVAMGLMIVLYVVKTLTAKEPPPPARQARLIPMATSDLAPGTVITDKHIGTGPWIDKVEDDVLLSDGGIIGRVVKNKVNAAEPIHGNDLYGHGELPNLEVSDGFRAVTIAIKSTASMLEGLLKPGDFADVIFSPQNLSSDPRFTKIGGISIVLFKGVRVLAVNRDFVQRPVEAANNSVTLEIAEDEAAILRLAANNGDIDLDFTPHFTGSATVKVSDPMRPTLEEILQLPALPEPPPPPPAPPKPDRFVSRVYRRSSLATNGFVDGLPTNNGSWSGNNGTGYDYSANGPINNGNGSYQLDANTTFIPQGGMQAYRQSQGVNFGQGSGGAPGVAPGAAPSTRAAVPRELPGVGGR